MRDGFFTVLLMTAVYIFNSLKRLIQCNNRSTCKHNLKHRDCSNSELDIHHDLFLCAKNPGHEKFFPISKFRVTNLPEGFRFTDIVKFIDLVSNLVVKITLDDVSTGRPRGSIFDLNHSNEDACSYGSGYLWNAQCCRWHSGVACPCRKCRHHRCATDWGELRIVTANHVVFDDAEASGATIELFYNDPHDLSGVTQLIGLKVVDSDMEGDRCEMIAIVHDRDMWGLLVQAIEYCYNSKRAQGAIENLTVQRGKNYLMVIVSHPHGSSKQVTVGRCLKRHVSASGTPLLKRINYDYDTPTCPGSSGAPVLVFGCERHTVSFAPHTRWDQSRKRNASGHAFELEQSDFWVEPPAPRCPFKLRTILRNKFISKSQRVKLLYRKCRTWIALALVLWLNLYRMFDFKTKMMMGTHALNSSITTLKDSSEPIETPSDVRTYQDSNQWQSARARSCAKQCHEKFIPFNTFTLNNLPPGYRDEDIVKAVRHLGILTGKLTVFSGNMSGKMVQGTCLLRYFDPRFVLGKTECPCPRCRSSGRPPGKWATFIASSSAHVMGSFKDGGLYVCELLYDDEKHPENIRKLYGQSVLKIDLDNDSCNFELVTHDMELCALVNETLKDFWRSVGQLEGKWLNTSPPYLVVIPSHPHGFSKHVTVGLTVDDDSDTNSDSVTWPVSDGPAPGNHQNTGNDVLSKLNISKVISYDEIFPQQRIFGLKKGAPAPSTDSPSPCTDTPTPSTDITTSNASLSTPNTGMSTPSTDTPTPSTDTPTPSTDTPTPSSETPTPNRDVHTQNGEMETPNGEIPSPNGGMTSPEGEIPSPNGVMTSPGGEIPSPNGGMTSPGGEIPSPNGGMTSPGREIPSPNGGMTSPGGEIPSPNGGMTSPGGEIPSPNGVMTSPGGEIPSPNGGMTSPGGEIPSPNGGMTSPGGEIPSPNGVMTSPGGEIPSPNGGMTSPGGEIPSPNEGMTSPGGEIPSPNGGMTSPGGEIPSPNGGMTSPGGEIPSPKAEISSTNCKSPSRSTLHSPRQYKYTSATCPGSAGAPLFILKGDRIFNVHSLHSGSRLDLYNMSSFTVDVNGVFAHLVKSPYIENI